jgi:hypothetical protein
MNVLQAREIIGWNPGLAGVSTAEPGASVGRAARSGAALISKYASIRQRSAGNWVDAGLLLAPRLVQPRNGPLRQSASGLGLSL